MKPWNLVHETPKFPYRRRMASITGCVWYGNTDAVNKSSYNNAPNWLHHSTEKLGPAKLKIWWAVETWTFIMSVL